MNEKMKNIKNIQPPYIGPHFGIIRRLSILCCYLIALCIFIFILITILKYFPNKNKIENLNQTLENQIVTNIQKISNFYHASKININSRNFTIFDNYSTIIGYGKLLKNNTKIQFWLSNENYFTKKNEFLKKFNQTKNITTVNKIYPVIQVRIEYFKTQLTLIMPEFFYREKSKLDLILECELIKNAQKTENAQKIKYFLHFIGYGINGVNCIGHAELKLFPQVIIDNISVKIPDV